MVLVIDLPHPSSAPPAFVDALSNIPGANTSTVSCMRTSGAEH